MNGESQHPEEGMPQKKAWYKTWWGVLLIIAFWPIAATWAIWKKTTWPKVQKVVATVVVVVFAIMGMAIGSSDEGQNTPPQNVTTTEQALMQEEATTTTAPPTTTTEVPATTTTTEPPTTTTTKAPVTTTTIIITTTTQKQVSPPAGGGPTVYVTNTGEKYHRDGCQYLKKSKIPISLSDAKAQGYGPCSRCNPPR